MPATDHRQIARFAELSDATFPAVLADRLYAARDNPRRRVTCVGVEYASDMAEWLLAEGAPGLHYITLNKSTAALDIHRNVLASPSSRILNVC
ncbi:hypothetical protein Sxan_22270 [Streptomyces xanthophaeus]|uniref:Methylenetetrahydrofolate reductase n=1 Tax=Streptomyces xanthophaeus TaxID=67385 RepID=A0A919H1A1_9ACTN|nr:hypothetical protein Sxan_22270 [Streptomyces xanthophaeus]